MSKLIALGLASVLTGVLGVGTMMAKAAASPHSPLSDLIANYKSWRRVNREPIDMKPYVAALCRGPLPWQGADNPHLPKFFSVYVNDLAAQTIYTVGPRTYKPGSIIVKEKLPSKAITASPELLTVMVKRDKGFDPEHGDWQYFTVDGSGEKVDDKEVAKCQSCHEQNKKNDYVFGDYIKVRR